MLIICWDLRILTTEEKASDTLSELTSFRKITNRPKMLSKNKGITILPVVKD
jgi:hypothetical protein